MTDTDVHPKFESRDALCSKIDEVLIQFFSVLTELYKEQDLLNDQMKSGFLNMSRARYSMGIKSVGISQCDQNNMTATMRVNVEDPDNLSLENVSKMSNIEKQFDDLRVGSDNSENVRKRNVAKKDEEVETVGMKKTTAVKDAEKQKSSSKIFDPIKWFGVLVPPALRQSQKDFQSSMAATVSIANLQRQLDTLGTQYSSLMKLKKDFPQST